MVGVALDDGVPELLEEAIQRTILGKPNQLEAVAAGMSKRAPKFRDPQ